MAYQMIVRQNNTNTIMTNLVRVPKMAKDRSFKERIIILNLLRILHTLATSLLGNIASAISSTMVHLFMDGEDSEESMTVEGILKEPF